MALENQGDLLQALKSGAKNLHRLAGSTLANVAVVPDRFSAWTVRTKGGLDKEKKKLVADKEKKSKNGVLTSAQWKAKPMRESAKVRLVAKEPSEAPAGQPPPAAAQPPPATAQTASAAPVLDLPPPDLSLIHISEPTRLRRSRMPSSA